MSDPNLPTPQNPGAPAPSERRGRASVTLRTDATRHESMSDLMDPANKSLADALRIAYRLLQGAIVVMAVIYFASGFQRIDAGEQGVRVTLGTIAADNLAPGGHFAWPAPVGEVIRIPTGVQRLDLKKQFFPSLSENEEKTLADPNMREQGLTGGGRGDLDPDSDGQLLTGDGSIVHARFLITYKRADPRQWLTTIAMDDGSPDRVEREIVTAAARRGIIHAASRMTIDEVLYNQPEPWRKPGEFTPLADLAKVSAQSAAGNEIQKAENDARQKLTEAAGEAAPVLLALIDRYETEVASGNRAAAETALNRVHDLMLRQPVEMDGKPVAAAVSGNVSQTISSATQHRSSVVSRAQADASVFNAKLQAYRSNPSVYLASEWRDALSTFLNLPNVQTMMLPADAVRTVIMLNRDPDITNEQVQQRLLKMQEEAARERDRKRMREIHERSIKAVE